MIDFLKSTIGRKYVMALTGLIWAGFIFVHMAGNMLMFVSPDLYNIYGHNVTSGGMIYFIEALLVVSLLAHVGCAISLVRDNRRARPQDYAIPAQGAKAATLAARTMAVTGSLILAFFIYHLVTFKYGPVYMTTVNGIEVRDLYRLLIEVFSKPGYVLWYLFCLILLGFHLRHGIGSLFLSLGILNDRLLALSQKLAILYAVVVAGGFLAQPIVIFLRSTGKG